MICCFTMHGIDIFIGRTCRRGYLDHAFKLHCTISPTVGAVTHRWTQWQHQVHFHATLPIMVIEIRFNFQIRVQCAEKAISNITFNTRWNLKQIWRSWHTWVSMGNIKVFENNGGLRGLISAIRPGLAVWPGVGGGGGYFFAWSSFPA